jgi:hypothetical protein
MTDDSRRGNVKKRKKGGEKKKGERKKTKKQEEDKKTKKQKNKHKTKINLLMSNGYFCHCRRRYFVTVHFFLWWRAAPH